MNRTMPDRGGNNMQLKRHCLLAGCVMYDNHLSQRYQVPWVWHDARDMLLTCGCYKKWRP